MTAPVLSTLVISDLKLMERTGKFDRDVLLFVQQSYVTRAVDNGSRCDSIDEVATAVRSAYEMDKRHGGGLDVMKYMAAAEEFYTQQQASHTEQLHSVAEKVHQPGHDLGELARLAYIAIAKLLRVSELLGRQQESGVQSWINGVSKTLRGRQLLTALQTVSDNPAAYIEWRDPQHVRMPARYPWEFSTCRRRVEETL